MVILFLKKVTQTVYERNTLLQKFKLVLLDTGMCKEVVFINLNHLALPFSQSVVQANICIMSETGTFFFKKTLLQKHSFGLVDLSLKLKMCSIINLDI